MSKTLVAYFSRADENWFGGSLRKINVGNTKVVAETISKLLNCDLCEIQANKKYPYGYYECCDVAKQEKKNHFRPEITININNVDQYDNIILGYPMWWGTYPMAVYTFLEKFNFKGKRFLPFATHEGSGMGESESELRKCCPDSKIEKGLALLGSNCHSCKSEVERWLKSNGLLN